jgi:hypothetical protein
MPLYILLAKKILLRGNRLWEGRRSLGLIEATNRVLSNSFGSLKMKLGIIRRRVSGNKQVKQARLIFTPYSTESYSNRNLL